MSGGGGSLGGPGEGRGYWGWGEQGRSTLGACLRPPRPGARGAPSPEGAGAEEPAQGPRPRSRRGSDLPVLNWGAGGTGDLRCLPPCSGRFISPEGDSPLPAPRLAVSPLPAVHTRCVWDS